MKFDRNGFNAPLLWPLALLVLGLLAAVVAAVGQQLSNEALVQKRLQYAAQHVADLVTRRVQLYEYGLRGARSAVLVAGNAVADVSRAHFRRFGASQDIPRQYPGVVGFAFARRVPVGGEAALLEGMRRQGLANVQLYQTAPHSGDRFIVEFIEPLEGNTQALGHDIASESRR
jgi:CHASE1-domain containing sensor protein